MTINFLDVLSHVAFLRSKIQQLMSLVNGLPRLLLKIFFDTLELLSFLSDEVCWYSWTVRKFILLDIKRWQPRHNSLVYRDISYKEVSRRGTY